MKTNKKIIRMTAIMLAVDLTIVTGCASQNSDNIVSVSEEISEGAVSEGVSGEAAQENDGDAAEKTNLTEETSSNNESEDETPQKNDSDTDVNISADDQEESMSSLPLSAGITIPELTVKRLDIPQGTAMEFADGLEVGFNLGNTFDAYLDPTPADEMTTETCWHGTYTTREMISDIHALGFDSIRIPVSWHNHVDSELNISAQWMDRVNEVVDWAIDEGMYAIIDIHHDNHPEAGGFYPDTAHMDQSVRYITRIWEQVSKRFIDYDEHLIFEGMNEPRLVGHENEWWINPANADCIDSIKCINELNQVFVDTVRASGGNNISRYLLCQGYDASVDGATNKGFALPTDPAEPDVSYADGHILIEIHAYTPYDFALEYPGISDFDAAAVDSTRELDTFMNKLYTTFIKNGYPVVIDEFGCRDKNGNLQDRVDFTAYYVRNARARGMSCFWWDNNAFEGDGELFGIYDRKGQGRTNYDIISAIMSYK